MALESARGALHTLRTDRPGTRFAHAHEHFRIDNEALRIGAILLGVLLMAAAAATFWLPGPNFVLVLVGLALIAAQSTAVAGLLDRAELSGRRWHRDTWKQLPAWERRIGVALLWVAFLVAVLGVAALAWRLGLLPSWLPFVD